MNSREFGVGVDFSQRADIHHWPWPGPATQRIPLSQRAISYTDLRKKSIHLPSKKTNAISTRADSSSYEKPEPNLPLYFLLRNIKGNA